MNLKFKDNPNLKLGITQLEYIDANGACSIQTDIVVNYNTSIMQSIMQIDAFPSAQWLYSCIFGSGQNAFGLGWDENQNTDRPIRLYPGLTITSFNFPRNERHDIEIYIDNGGRLKYDGELILSNSSWPIIPNNSKFYFNFGGNLPFRYYRVCVKQSDVVVLDLYPAKDFSGVVCFYDTVSGTFFYNQDTGSFIAGPVIKSGFPVLNKITTLYHQNCPNIGGYDVLKSIISYSKDNQPEVKYNFYKDSPLWNSIKTEYPALIPYTDACHAMLGDICTCITPGPMQLASACNDIIQQGTIDAYLESTGTQYLNTGFKPQVGDEFEVTYMITGIIGTYNTVFGTRVSSTSNAFMFGYQSGGSYIELGSNNISNFNKGYTQNVKHTIKLEGGKLYVDSVYDRDIAVNQSAIHNLLLFTLNNNGSLAEYGRCRIYSFTIKRNGVKVLDLIPAYNGAVATMKDLVSNTFLTPLGSGNFTLAGAVVEEGINITDYVPDCTYDETPITLFNRVRVDIGNVSGSLIELLKYSTLNGFNDNYEPQDKPRLVGTWTINDWYYQSELDEAQAAFDGLTIIASPALLINLDNCAVQGLDPMKPNYNPAVISRMGIVGLIPSGQIVSGKGAFITIDQAAAINDTSFYNNNGDVAGIAASAKLFRMSTITDTLGCCIESWQNGELVPQTFLFTSASEFRYFTGVTKLFECIRNGENLQSNYGGVPPFSSCTNMKEAVLPESLQKVGTNIFRECGDTFKILRFLGLEVPTFSSNTTGVGGMLYNTNPNIYIGKTSHNRYLQYRAVELYKVAQSVYASKIYDWYSYVAPQLSYDGTDVFITVQRSSTIYYTIDGSTPTEQSTEYTQPFAWDGQGVIKAIAVDNTAHPDDRIVYADDFYSQTCANPIITISNNQVILSCTTPGYVIYYTTDGSFPTLNSTIYTDVITSQEDTLKIRCFATAPGYNNSEIVGKMCILNDSLWGTDGDTSAFAVQCIDSTKPNYNPAVCIILNNNSKLTDTCYSGGGGYLTKIDAAAATQNQILRVFCNNVTVVDIDKIVNSSGDSFDFETFHEFKYFTVFPNVGSWADSGQNGFQGCKKLREITIPSNVDKIITNGWADGGFRDCTALETVNMPNTITEIGDAVFNNCRKLKNISLPQTITSIGGGAFMLAGWDAVLTEDDYIDLNLPNLTALGAAAFNRCKLIKRITNLGSITQLTHANNYDGTFTSTPIISATLPSTLTSMTYFIFNNISNNAIIHLLPTTPPTIPNRGDTFSPVTVKLYVGDGSSAVDDAAVLQSYLADSNWNTYYGSRLDTWYNYLHPQS